jgi:hypothetical protein
VAAFARLSGTPLHRHNFSRLAPGKSGGDGNSDDEPSLGAPEQTNQEKTRGKNCGDRTDMEEQNEDGDELDRPGGRAILKSTVKLMATMAALSMKSLLSVLSTAA